MVLALSLAVAYSCAAAVAAPSRPCTMIADDSVPVCDTEASSLLQHSKIITPENSDSGPGVNVHAHATLAAKGTITDFDGQLKHAVGPPNSELSIGKSSVHRNFYSKIAAMVVGGMIFLAIVPILFHNGPIPFMVVLVYLTSLIVVKFAVKQTMSLGYGYPYTITAFHMLSTAVAAICFDRPGFSEAFKVLPISVTNSISLALNNTALLYGGVAFTSMVGSCAPAPTYVFEVLFGRRGHWTDGLLGTLLVCVGSVLCVHGETTASFLCFILAAGATVCRALKSIFQQELLAVKVTPMVMLFWTGFWGFLFLLPVILWEEGAGGLKSLPSISIPALLALLLSIVSATMLNICQVFAVKQLGSLQQVTIGNLNCIFAIALAAATRGEVILDVQYLGTLLVMLGAPLSKKSTQASKGPDVASNKQPADVQQKTPA
eukprot:TRINITY_DN108160_c0_g1_i1.p1 TRINITY_DN108160_c0_g1~~TRINITY_DN108160_c0_g1_i1.p1  ORF type:complete len:432 (-),score=76.20 TRINITY_DN108160_c0_g1_i1:101-1396(-)